VCLWTRLSTNVNRHEQQKQFLKLQRRFLWAAKLVVSSYKTFFSSWKIEEMIIVLQSNTPNVWFVPYCYSQLSGFVLSYVTVLSVTGTSWWRQTIDYLQNKTGCVLPRSCTLSMAPAYCCLKRINPPKLYARMALTCVVIRKFWIFRLTKIKPA
jgi:hypothetical protein